MVEESYSVASDLLWFSEVTCDKLFSRACGILDLEIHDGVNSQTQM